MIEVSLALVSYKRPKFTKECLKALKRKPGIKYELLHWKNDKKNLGSDALEVLLKKARGKYFVIIEEDMIWFQDNWLKELVEGFEKKPEITKEGLEMGYKNEWGMLATSCLIDDVNNGGMWEVPGKICIDNAGTRYWTNIYAGGGPVIMKTETLRNIGDIWGKARLNGTLHRIQYLYEQAKYPMGILRDTYIYHAASPYWNKLYKKVWLEKQTDQTIEEAFKVYSGKGNFNWNNKRPMEMFLKGQFNKYSNEIFNNRR